MKTLEEMAREAGMFITQYRHVRSAEGASKAAHVCFRELERFAALVRAQAMEEAAIVCDKQWVLDGTFTARAFAESVRSAINEGKS